MSNVINVGDFVSAKFATVNKHDSLAAYKAECGKPEKEMITRVYGDTEYDDVVTNWREESCKVEQIFELTLGEWDYFVNNLLSDQIIWRDKGGTIYTGSDENFDYDKLGSDPAMLQDFKANNAGLVTILKNASTGELIAINSEGYKYARYVGIEVVKTGDAA